PLKDAGDYRGAEPRGFGIWGRYLGRRRSRDGSAGRWYSWNDLRRARDVREFQRARVMTMHEGFKFDIESQLKRLRLERVFLVSLLVATVSLVVRWVRDEPGAAASSGWLVLAAVAAAVLMVFLVHERFRRYASAIARGFSLVERGETQSPAGVTVEPADDEVGPTDQTPQEPSTP
ncbi:MAG: hypothetical protein R2734_21475, partial [Nocardioides sp.]